MQFGAKTRSYLAKIIADQVALAEFERAALSAFADYRDMKAAMPTVDAEADRRELERMRHRSHRNKIITKRGTPQSVMSLLRQGILLAGGDWVAPLEQMPAGEVESGAAAILNATRPLRNGRPLDGAGIILISALADAFERAGQTASSGFESRFVQAVREMMEDQRIYCADPRGKIRTALRTVKKRGI